MSKRDLTIGSAILDDAWRVTARAPRAYPGSKETIFGVVDDIRIFGDTYSHGLDVLGAGLAKSDVAKATARGTEAGNRAIQAGNRLSRRKPKTGAKLKSLGAKAISQAKSAAKNEAKKMAAADAAKKAAVEEAKRTAVTTVPVVRPVLTESRVYVAPTPSAVTREASRVATTTAMPSVKTTTATTPPPSVKTTYVPPAYVPPAYVPPKTTTVAPPPVKTISPAATSAALQVAKTITQTSPSPAVRTAFRQVKTLLRGDVNYALMSEAQTLSPWAPTLESLAQLGEAEFAILETIVNLKTLGSAVALSVAKDGQQIADDADYYINGVDEEFFEKISKASLIPGVASDIVADAERFQAKANEVLSPAAATGPTTGPVEEEVSPFDPGTSGGGGGGGGGDAGGGEDEGAPVEDESSEEVRQFREEGRDPFEEEAPPSEGGEGGEGGGEGGAFDEGSVDEAAEAITDREAAEVEAAVQAQTAAYRDGGAVADDTAWMYEGESEEATDELDAGGEVDEGEGAEAEDTDTAPLLDTLEGLVASDYKFNVMDLFMPHQGVQRTMKEVEAREAEQQAAREAEQAAREAEQQEKWARELAAIKPGAIHRKKLALAKRRLEAQLQRQRELAQQDTPEGDVVMGTSETGFDLTEAPDLNLDGYERQITDEPGDPLRGRASAHRGAAYLEEHYPPGGSSAAPAFVEDEIMGHRHGVTRGDVEEIFGAIGDLQIFGGGCYSRGLDVLGATPRPFQRPPQRAGFVQKTTPRGRKFTALVVNKPKAGDYKSTYRNAQDAGKRAISVGNKMLSLLRKVPANKTAVRGAVLKSKSRPGVKVARKRLSPAQAKKLAEKLVKSGRNLLSNAEKLNSNVMAAAAKEKSNAAALKAKMFGSKVRSTLSTALKPGARGVVSKTLATPSAAPSVRTTTAAPVSAKNIAARQAVLGALASLYSDHLEDIHAEILGQAVVDQATNDANAESDFYSETDSSGMRVAGPEDAPAPYGIGPIPTEAPARGGPITPGSDPATDRTFYNTKEQPLAGIVYYQNEMGVPRDKLGSWNRYYGPEANIPHGGAGVYWTGHNFASRNKAGDPGSDVENWSAGDVMEHLTPGGQARAGWGPLVGAPDGDMKGLRFDLGLGSFFWFWDQAPKWAKGKVDENLKLLHQAQVDYGTELETAEANFAEQELQDMVDADVAEKERKRLAKEAAEFQRQIEKEQKEQQHQANLQAVVDESAAKQEAMADEAEARRQTMADEGAAAAEERRARMEDERQARAEERAAAAEEKEIEFLSRMAAQEAQTEEAAAVEEALQPPPGEEPGEGDAMSESYDLEQAPLPPIEEPDYAVDEADSDVLGFTYPRVTAVDRIRARRDERR